MAKAPTLQQLRFRALLAQLEAEEGGYRARTRVAKRVALAQPQVSMYLDGVRFASDRTVERVRQRLRVRPAFFTEETPGDPHYKDFVASERVEREVPESFRLWRESSLRPPGLTPAIEERMLSMGFRFPPEEAYRWGTLYDLVRAGQPRDTTATREAREEAARLGLKKPRKR